ncbi:hypothetical protein D9M68_749790 [compost metagenome]
MHPLHLPRRRRTPASRGRAQGQPGKVRQGLPLQPRRHHHHRTRYGPLYRGQRRLPPPHRLPRRGGHRSLGPGDERLGRPQAAPGDARDAPARRPCDASGNARQAPRWQGQDRGGLGRADRPQRPRLPAADRPRHQPAEGGPGAGPAPGLPRLADQSAQSRPADGPPDPADRPAQAPRFARRPAVSRSRPLQAHQRLARPSDRR